MTFSTRIVLLLASITLISFSTLAQQASPPTDAPVSGDSAQNPPAQSAPEQNPPAAQSPDKNADTGKDKDKNKKDEVQDKDKSKDAAGQGANGEGKVAGTSNDRLFYTLPNFLSLENAKNLPPLSAKDKFKVVALGTFDPIQLPWWGLLSAIGQAEDSEPAYGQGWGAYGRRYATVAADSTIENFMVGAVFPAILRQDPRFYEMGHGSFFHRTFYAVSRSFVTRSDSGHTQFNSSEIVGGAFSAAVSTYSYHPRATYLSTPTNPHMFIPSDRTLVNTASVWGTQLGLDTMTLVVKEFWPDIHRKISRKKTKAAVAQQAGAKP